MITTYAELKTNIADFMHRSDLTGVIPTFIQLAESKIANNIKGRKLTTVLTTTLTANTETLSLPADYVSIHSIVVLSTTNSVCSLISDTKLSEYNAKGDKGIPKYFSIVGDTIRFSAIPDSGYTVKITYEANLIKLTDVVTTNFILTNFPYLYLYGALIEASIYSNDPDQVQFYQQKYNEAIAEVNAKFDEQVLPPNINSSKLTNYTELKSNIADFMHRSDLDDIIPTFIQLAESKIANNIKGRKLSTSLTTTLTAGVETLALPLDYVSMQSVVILSNPQVVCELISDHQLANYNSLGTTGIPQFYNIIGDNIYFSLKPDSSYSVKLTYETKLVSLSNLVPTNFILDNYPYLYLYGALIEGSIFANDLTQVQLYQQKYDDAIYEVLRKFGEESWSGNVMRSFSDYVV
jgi:hypothetical protein